MMPLENDAHSLLRPAEGKHLARRRFLQQTLASLGLAAISTAGCATPLFRGQSPDDEAPLPTDDEDQLELVGDYSRAVGLNWHKLESIALVTKLDNTGSDPPPSSQRDALKGEMQSHEIRDADKILASPTTSMVILRGWLPPGVQKGDTFDVEVRTPSRSETTSLRGGWVMPSRMRAMEVLNGTITTGSTDALAQGDLLVDAIFESGNQKVLENRGRLLGGGISAISRKLGLAVNREEASIRISTLIGKAINQRFYTMDAGVKKGVSEPQRDNYLELEIAPRYKHNLARYLRVIRNLPLKETAVERTERLPLLQRKLLEPTSSGLASIQLEALGNEAIPALKKGLESSDPEVRFYSAEALAYLDQPEASQPLGEAAKNESAFRWHALTALATVTHVTALDALTELLHVASVETRYGAFRSLRIRNPGDPTTKGELLDKKFRYHLIATTGEPLVHLTRTRMPEIVVFGHEQRLKPTSFLFAGKKIMVKGLENGDFSVRRYSAGQETQEETCSAELDKLIRTVVKVGGGYAEVVQLLHEAKKAGCLESRLAVEAVPRPDRKYYRNDDPLPEAPADDEDQSPDAGANAAPAGNSSQNQAPATRRADTPTPELFNDGSAFNGPDNGRSDSKAAEGETYVDPEYAPKPKKFFDRLNPFSQ
jgi:flagellar basal body P-ring protein FlgI